jgi:NADPH-dependent 2,4-dienoyl-CoA reductase/sulfur reductase-like enzyme/nitrite reductase/ring-hydroxylating ferredoxin subunit
MGGAQEELTGPDLEAGVALDDLRDGEMLGGHAGGEPVLLARRGDHVFAVTGKCSHYGGPLAEGLMVGETVRCPWHHACFDLRTGVALRAPALNPVACWTVELNEGRVRVTGKTEREPLGPDGESTRETLPNGIVIIGAGAAGNAAAEMLRRLGFGGAVTVVDPDPASPYDRPNLSKDYLAGNAPEEWIPLRPDGFHRSHDIRLVRATAETVSIAARRVRLTDGRAVAYDRLLLAMGAKPIRLEIPGADAAQVHYLRSLDDSRAIIAKTTGARRAVVIGASFIGLEVAASLRARELEVHVVGPETILYERILGQAMGDFIRALHEEHGVTFHLGQTAAAIAADAVILTSGDRLPCDIVVVGIGVRPALELAERAGLSTQRGVVVNEYLETSAPGIYAAGDIARYPDPRTGETVRIEHWVHAERMGQAAARNMLGARTPFRDVPFFWSQHYDVPINYVGHAERWDTVTIDGPIAERDCAVRYTLGGRTMAVASIFRDRVSLEAEVAMENEAAAER